MTAARTMTILLLLATSVALSSCAGAGTPGYARAYNAGRFSTALREATAEAAVSTGRDREEAALIAGLAAHALGDDSSAANWLTPLLNSSDRSISGRAYAGLGLIARDRGDNERAAALLTTASRKLSGDDAAHASLNAGDALEDLGRKEAAREQYQLGYSQAKDRALQATLTSRLNNQRWTIQLGAFANRRNAERAAREHAAEAAGVGLGAPFVTASMEHGRRLYLVQVGEFRSRAEADAARSRLGVSAIVAAADDS